MPLPHLASSRSHFPQSVHLIEFPSLLLPAGVGPGSIVNIACTRNTNAEKHQAREFWDLQRDIADLFGSREPQPPQLRVRNTTQTSVTLEWDKLDLASASLLNLSIYRNGQRLTTIPNPLSNTSTKLSGLSLDTDYQFHLVLKTSGGTLASPTVKTRTHTIDNTTGISACFGLVEPDDLAREAKRVIGDLGAKSDTKIQVHLPPSSFLASRTFTDSACACTQIDTTHYVATSPASPSAPDSGPSVEYQKAVQLSIVRPSLSFSLPSLESPRLTLPPRPARSPSSRPSGSSPARARTSSSRSRPTTSARRTAPRRSRRPSSSRRRASRARGPSPARVRRRARVGRSPCRRSASPSRSSRSSSSSNSSSAT